MSSSYLTLNSNQPLTHLDLLAMKQRGEKITCLTAYDASFAALIDTTGIEVILVGDSLGMVIQGHVTTCKNRRHDLPHALRYKNVQTGVVDCRFTLYDLRHA
jgi:3-methyl-2-oxobutanoate hydroxymethyltransferase